MSTEGCVTPEERLNTFERLPDIRPIQVVIEPMLATRDRDQRVRNGGGLQGRGHQDRLLVRNVRIDIAMQEQRRRKRGRDEPNWTKRLEDRGVLLGIRSPNLQRPCATLPAEEVEAMARLVPSAFDRRNRVDSHACPGIGFGDEWHRQVERVGPASREAAREVCPDRQ